MAAVQPRLKRLMRCNGMRLLSPFRTYCTYRSLMMAAEARSSMESTVDMIAARGPAMKTPAQNGGSSSSIRLGMAMSPTARPGMTARPSTPRPTSTQKERIMGWGTASLGPVGVMRPGSMALRRSMQASMPPPAWTTASSTTTEATVMTMPCMASVRTTARNPPSAV